jgi:hypothetical protein
MHECDERFLARKKKLIIIGLKVVQGICSSSRIFRMLLFNGIDMR